MMKQIAQQILLQRRSLLVAAGALAVGAFAMTPAWSQSATWNPTRPIKMVVPFAPGGGADVSARAVVDKLGQKLGQVVIIDNRAGAGGTLGGEAAFRAAPDGYTLMWATSEMLTVAPHMYLKLNYKPLDFVPIGPTGRIGFVLVSRSDLGVKTFPELVALARTRELSFASWGNGSAGHLGSEMFKHHTKVPKVLSVPYQGAAPAAQAVMGNQVDLTFMPMPLWLGLQSKVTTLAVAAKSRYERIKQVPTMAELGVPADLEGWQGVFAPPQTPQPVVDRIAKALAEVMADAEVRKKLEEIGVEPPLSVSHEDFAKSVAPDLAKWGEIMRLANVKPQ
jgi:tripartite-type tricarboxylate transporter receptor subunit TctC